MQGQSGAALAGPAVVPHKLGQRGPPVRAILSVGPAERDDRRALDPVGDAEDRVDARLPPAVQRREAALEPSGSGRQQEILHAGVDRGTRLEAGPAGGGGVDTGDDQDGCRRQGLTRAPGRRRRARASSYTALIACFTVGGRVHQPCGQRIGTSPSRSNHCNRPRPAAPQLEFRRLV
jgi:hypothetical protein